MPYLSSPGIEYATSYLPGFLSWKSATEVSISQTASTRPITICWYSSATFGYGWTLIAWPAGHFALAAVTRSWTSPPPWIETLLPQRSASDLIPFGLPAGTITTWLVLKYGTASATWRRVSLMYRAVQTRSQRFAWSAGISPSNAVLTMFSFRPSFFTTAWYDSTSKPIGVVG